MLLKHLKANWWIYYLAAGGVYGLYEFVTNDQTETIFGTALNIAGWPFFIISNIETSLGRQL